MAANVLTTIEIRAETGRTREEIVQALQDTQREARATAAEFERLKQKSIDETAAVTKLSESLARLNLSQTTNRQSAAELKSEIGRLEAGYKADEKALKSHNTELDRVTNSLIKATQAKNLDMVAITNYRNEQLRLQAAIQQAQQSMSEYTRVMEQRGSKLEQVSTAEQTAARMIIETKNELNKEREALNSTNEAKNRSAMASQQAANAERNVTAEARQFNGVIREQQREVDKLNSSQAALAVTAGTLLAGAIRDTIRWTATAIKDTVIYAARTDELSLVMGKLAAANGISTGAINAQAESIQRLNIAAQDTRQVLSQFVVSQLDLSKASQLARVAQDLAVVAGVDSAEEFQKLTQGIETLQIRTLRTAGVFVGLDGILDKAAKTMHRTRDSFTEQEKQSLLLNEVLDFGTRVTGTYETAMENAGKQMRSLTRLVGDAKNAFGGLFQDVFTVVIKAIETFLKVVSAAPGGILLLGASISGLALLVLRQTVTWETWKNKLKESLVVLTQVTAATFGLSAAEQKLNTDTTQSLTRRERMSASVSGARAPNVRAAAGVGIGTGLAAGIGTYASGGSVGASLLTGALAGGGSAAITALATAGTAATAGILALVAGLGSLVYVIYRYATAQKEANFVADETIQLQLRRARTMREDVVELNAQADALENTSLKYKQSTDDIRLMSLSLERLGIRERESINNKYRDVEATTQQAAKLREVARLTNELRKTELERLITTQKPNLTAVRVASGEIDRLQSEQREFAKLLDVINQAVADRDAGRTNSIPIAASKLGFGTTESASLGRKVTAESDYFGSTYDTARKNILEKFGKNATEVEKYLTQTKGAYDALGQTYVEYNKTSATTVERFVQEQIGIKKTAESYDLIVQKIRNHVETEKINSGVVLDAATAYKKFREQLDGVKIGQTDLNATTLGMTETTERLVNQINNMSIAGKYGKSMFDLEDVFNANIGALNSFDDSIKNYAGGSQAKYDSFIENLRRKNPQLVEMLINARLASAKTVKGIADDQAEVVHKLYDTTQNLSAMQRDINSLMSGGVSGDPTTAQMFYVERLSKRLEQVRSEMDSINSARENLGVDVGAPMPSTREGREDLKSTYDQLIKLRDGIREAQTAEKNFVYEVIKSQQTITQGIISSEMLAAKMLADNRRTRLQEEQQLHAQLIVMSIERENRLKNEAEAQRRTNLEYYTDRSKELDDFLENQRKVQSEMAYGRGETIQGLNIPQYGNINTALPNAPLPTQQEIDQLLSVQSIQQDTTINREQVESISGIVNSIPGVFDSNTQLLLSSGTSNLDKHIQSDVTQTDRIVNAITTSMPNTGMFAQLLGQTTTASGGVAPTDMGGSTPIRITQGLADFLKSVNPNINLNALHPNARGLNLNQVHRSGGHSYRVADMVKADIEAASKYGIDPTVAFNMTMNESGFNPFLYSGTGPAGLKQIANRTGKSLGLSGITKVFPAGTSPDMNDQRFDPYASIDAGNRLMSQLLRSNNGNYVRALNAYSSGDPNKMYENSPAYLNRILRGRKDMAAVPVSSVPSLPKPLSSVQTASIDPMKNLETIVDKFNTRTPIDKRIEEYLKPTDVNRQTDLVMALDKVEKERYASRIQNETTIAALTSKTEQLYRANIIYRQNIDAQVERTKIEGWRNSQDVLESLLSEERLQWRGSVEYSEQLSNEAAASRIKENHDAFDELARLREEDIQREDNYVKYRQTMMMKFESARRQEYNKTKERIVELNSEEMKIWRESADFQEQLVAKVEIARRETLLASRDALRQFNAEQLDRTNNPSEYRERVGLDAELERRRGAQQTVDEIQKLNVLESQNWFNSIEYRTNLNNKFELSRRNESLKTRDEIYTHQLEIANHDEVMTQKMAAAYDKAMTRTRDLDDEATLSIIDNMRTIEDHQTLHTKRVEASLVDWMANQRGVTDIVTDAMTQTLDVAFSGIDSLIGKVTKEAGAFGEVFQNLFGGFIKLGITNLIGNITGAGQETQNQGKGFFDMLLGSFGGNVKNATGIEQQLKPMHVPQMFVTQMFVAGSPISNLGGGSRMPIPFLNGNSTQSNSGFGSLNTYAPGGTGTFTGASMGNVFSSPMSQARNASAGLSTFGSYGMPADLPNGTTISQQTIPGMFSGIGNLGTDTLASTIMNSGTSRVATTGSGLLGIGTQAINGTGLTRQTGFFNGGIGQSLAMMLPGIGGSLGGMLGGQSPTGSVLGQVGGLLGGLAGMSALMSTSTLTGIFGSSIGGFLGGAAAIPILAPIAGALLIGAYFLGRNAKRRKEETMRDKAAVDALGALQKLLNGVQRDKIDGSSAIAQAQEIRSQYIEQMSKLTDKKTRSHALADVSRLDAIIAQIQTAAKSQERRKAFNDALVPEFASGGIVSNGAGMVVPGIDMGYDTVPAMLRPGEVVLNKQQQAYIGGHAALAAARVPGFVKGGLIAARRYADGGEVSLPSVTPKLNSGNNAGMNIYLVTDKKFAQDMAVAGRDKIIEMSAADVRDKGKIYAAVRKV
jgi:hypothetical protein